MDTQEKPLKIGFYNPYFDSLGGGERYVLTIAAHWSKHHDVTLFWNDSTVKKQAEDRFGLDLSNVSVVPNIFAGKGLIKKLVESASYDVIFFLSDGSVPTTFARCNIMHFQVPFQHIMFPLWKAKWYQAIVVNSEFTKQSIDPTLPLPVRVIYPPVDVSGYSGKKKSKTILSVGRFNGLYAAKKQEVMIEMFIELIKDKACSGWKLVLAGGSLSTDVAYLTKLQRMANGHAITFAVNCSYEKLRSLYEEASVYWHAAGFGETKPENMEHFGITTVEAMAASCVPVVHNAGGQPEIVNDNVNGYLWNTKEECIKKTKMLISDAKLVKKLVVHAKDTATKFSVDVFTNAYDELLTTLCL